jgi:hypothetical protein
MLLIRGPVYGLSVRSLIQVAPKIVIDLFTVSGRIFVMAMLYFSFLVPFKQQTICVKKYWDTSLWDMNTSRPLT